jgi:hypothetical protein
MNINSSAAWTSNRPATNADSKLPLPQPDPKPDFYGTTVWYGTNDEKKLKTMYDQKGNSVTYTLDKTGKRIAETDVHLQATKSGLEFTSQTFAYDSKGNRIAKSPPVHRET